MLLKKGFLKPSISLEILNLDKIKLVVGIFYWVLLSFSIYSVLVIFRETFRYYSFWLNEEDILVLSPFENYFYNVFFSFLACTFSFTAISNLWLRRSSTLRNISGYNKAIIFHDKVSFSWYFILWSAKMGFLFYVCTELGSFLDFDLFPDYLVVLILMPIILFLHQWLRLRLVFKNAILPWMVGVFLSITVVSLLFGLINILPYKALNDSLFKRTIGYYITVELPILINGKQFGKKSLLSEMYIGYPQHNVDAPPLIMARPGDTLMLSQISLWVNEERSKVNEFDRYGLLWNLHIDRSVRMEHVKLLKGELWKNDIRGVYFATIKARGISQIIRDPQEDYLRILNEVDNEVTLLLEINNDIVSIDGKQGDDAFLNKRIKSFFRENGKNGVVLFKVDNTSHFEKYILTFDCLISVIKELRDEWLMEKFNVHYVEPEFYEHARSELNQLAAEQYPANILEFN